MEKVSDIQNTTLEEQDLPDLVREAIREAETETEPQGANESAGESKPPTILIMHSSVGSGHRSAAVAIAQMIEKMRDEGEPAFPDGSPLPANTRVEVLDSLDYGRIHFNGDRWASSFTGATRPYYDITWRYTFTGRLLWGGGTGISTVMFPRFTKYVREVKPIAVIATHIMGANIAVGARMLTKQNFPVVSVPTDYETEGLWPHAFTDAFCVGTDFMAETLRARKIEELAKAGITVKDGEDFTGYWVIEKNVQKSLEKYAADIYAKLQANNGKSIYENHTSKDAVASLISTYMEDESTQT